MGNSTAVEADFQEPYEGLALVRNRRIIWHDVGLAGLLGYAPHELAGHQTRILYPDEKSYARCGEALYAPGRTRPEVAVRLRTRCGRTVACVLRSHPLEGATETGLWMVFVKRPHPPETGHMPDLRESIVVQSVARAMAQELRNPLSVIRGYTQFLFEELQGTAAARKLDDVLKAADELRARLNAFLCFFAVAEPARARVDLNVMLADLVPELEALASSYLVTVKGEVDRQPCTVYADEDVLRYALLELAWSALEGLKSHPLAQLRIRCSYIRKEHEIEVVIRRSGSDIIPWQPGHRPESLRWKTPSTAETGLAVARAVILHYGGRVSFGGGEGEGEGEGLVQAVIRMPEALRDD